MIFYFIGLILTVVGALYLIFPSQKRSNKYGYRTPRAKFSDASFAYAQKEASKAFLIIGLITFAIGFTLKQLGLLQFFIIELFLIIIPITRVFYMVEKKLEIFIDQEEGAK
ncbi:SdpI family protein [Vagococcus sp. DIV0080]|uniref:SdpI family protein n=1 Tax=Candidatus Vagococcus giribetii TaxID=2230876 RepID=A0ABS3HUX0_9ENTE|nr:SdpI family protein [Vagococcus sp. DIV0080]MBO0477554.1 SdpI family protein [Vagococcus sp. DIV0080]